MITRIGLIQSPAGADKQSNIAGESIRIRKAAGQGAQVICLKELCQTPYFCREQNPDHFDLAEPLPGPTTDAFAPLARELEVVLIVPIFEKAAPGVYFNSAAIIDADGSVLGTFRKMHIPQDPEFEEKFYFAPGDLGYRVWKTRYADIGVLICWDQWFPEAARLTALRGAQILFYPTAIGWLSGEKDELGAAQHCAWETVQRGHAVANGCFVAAANRVGREGNTEFWGQSFVSNCYGEVVGRASAGGDENLIVDCDLGALEAFRRIWPFYRDRRVDTFAGLQERVIAPGPAAQGGTRSTPGDERE